MYFKVIIAFIAIIATISFAHPDRSDEKEKPGNNKYGDKHPKNPNGNGNKGGKAKNRGEIDSEEYTRKKKPHILYILLDDVGWNDVGWHNEKMNTPFMNQLAKEGVILNNFYTMSICTPSRVSFLTGKYAQQSGLQRGVLGQQEPYGIPLKQVLLPKILKKYAGYRTGIIGKWHLGYCDWDYTPTKRGFDTFFGFYNGAEESYYHCLSKQLIFDPISNCSDYDFRRNEKDVHLDYEGQYSGFLYAKEAQKIIEKHNKKQPMFMYLSLTDAHFPVKPPKRFLKRCENEVTKVRKTFCAAMAASDEAIRNVTTTLKKSGMYENTIIVLTSDNGGSVHFGGNNYPLRGNKEGLWEGGSRVPGFVHSPLLKKKGYVYNGIIHMVDWYATFLELAGIKPKKSWKLQGFNQWNAISEGKESPRDEFPYSVDVIEDVFIGALRKGNFKFIAGPAGNPDTIVTETETKDYSYNATYLSEYVTLKDTFNLSDTTPKLFNLVDDPSESHNLAEIYPEKVEELRKRLDYYQRISKNAIKFDNDPAGDPDNFNNVYSPGWCNAFYDVPNAKDSYYMNINKGDMV